MRRKSRVILMLCLAIAAGLFGYFVYRFTDTVLTVRETALAAAAATPTPEPTPSTTPAPTPTPVPTPVPTPTPTPYVSPIDFDALHAQNEHIYAWIELPGTGLAYPILQHPTIDTYYLNITVDGYEGYPGSIFTFPIEGQRFDQFNTVIYGHNMMDGSMFGDLKSFRSEWYMREHRQLKIYTPEETLTYTIFAALTYDDRLITLSYDDFDRADRQAYLDSILSSDGLFLTDDVTVDTDSHLVTLSTCIGGMPNNRLLVLGVLTEWEPEWLDLTPPDDFNTLFERMPSGQ